MNDYLISRYGPVVLVFENKARKRTPSSTQYQHSSPRVRCKSAFQNTRRFFDNFGRSRIFFIKNYRDCRHFRTHDRNAAQRLFLLITKLEFPDTIVPVIFSQPRFLHTYQVRLCSNMPLPFDRDKTLFIERRERMRCSSANSKIEKKKKNNTLTHVFKAIRATERGYYNCARDGGSRCEKKKGKK